MKYVRENRPQDTDRGPLRHGREARHGAFRRQILRGTAVLPALCTVMNGISGFASIHFATKDKLGEASAQNLTISAWMIFVAMVWDMLDGRLARMTRRTSEFGAQLDSLSDLVSFGVAPAMLMLRTTIMAMQGQIIERINFLPDNAAMGRTIWCIAALFVACAILRLARFNVENEPDESAHMDFAGLPSPAAAAAIASTVLLFAQLAGADTGWRSNPYLLATVSVLLPVLAFSTALLMVSRFRYPHLVNHYIRGRKSFGYLVKMVLLALAAVLAITVGAAYVAVAAAAILFAYSGLVGYLWRVLRHKKQPPADEMISI
jgi:CDP-diacylglycerol--serine O-phosphatidyltransferase